MAVCLKEGCFKVGMVVSTCNPSNREVEAGGSRSPRPALATKGVLRSSFSYLRPPPQLKKKKEKEKELN